MKCQLNEDRFSTEGSEVMICDYHVTNNNKLSLCRLILLHCCKIGSTTFRLPLTKTHVQVSHNWQSHWIVALFCSQAQSASRVHDFLSCTDKKKSEFLGSTICSAFEYLALFILHWGNLKVQGQHVQDASYIQRKSIVEQRRTESCVSWIGSMNHAPEVVSHLRRTSLPHSCQNHNTSRWGQSRVCSK